MNKKLIAVAIAAAVAAPAAMADVTIYGKVRQSIDMLDSSFTAIEDGEVVDSGSADYIEIKDQASRLGFKGSEDLGDGMKAVWQMEFGVNISNGGDEFTAKSPVMTARNAFVGLAGDFGTVLVGRHDTPLKISTGSLDPFADSSADYNSAYMEGLVDLRADGTLAYISPSFSGLTVAAALVPGENNEADGIADAWSAAAMYSNGGIFLTAAMESGDADIDFLQDFAKHPQFADITTGPLSNGYNMDYDQWRVGGSYTMDAFKVGAMYANTEFDSASETVWPASVSSMSMETDTWSIFGTYTMGNNVFKVKYFDSETDVGTVLFSNSDFNDSITVESDGWVIGMDHNFSARTQVSLLYVNADAEASAVINSGFSSDVDEAVSTDTEIFSVQLNHSF